MNRIDTFKALLEKGQDNALLRYSLAAEYQRLKDYQGSIGQLEKALAFDPGYSAAWKLYARALCKTNQVGAARTAYQKGIRAAEQNGDKQAAREMRVFLKRLDKP